MVLLLCRLAISQCYTDINCTGTIIAAVGGRDCCVEKANGVSFRISKGSSCTTCIGQYRLVVFHRLDLLGKLYILLQFMVSIKQYMKSEKMQLDLV